MLFFFSCWNSMMQGLMGKFCGALCCEGRFKPNPALICPHWLVGIAVPFIMGGLALTSLVLLPYFVACGMYRRKMDEPSCWASGRCALVALRERQAPMAQTAVQAPVAQTAVTMTATTTQPRPSGDYTPETGIVVDSVSQMHAPGPVVTGRIVAADAPAASSVVVGRVVDAGPEVV